jgi:transcriptional regulator with GAF, ATPase, and Fis domain
MVPSTIDGVRSSERRAVAARCTLHVVFPPEARQSFPLRQDQTVVGRDPGLDGLLLDHGTISRRHAAVTWSAPHAGHTVQDLGSRNGTRADGVSAASEPRPLTDGSIVRLGDTLLVYEQEIVAGQTDEDDAAVSGDAVPGQAARIVRLRALMARAARDRAPVLIRGETGTGKERVAHEVHRLSGRAGKLVALNCAALSAQLVESQLFGHVKGAFTGATDAQPGLFRAAHGGTLFLDEIGDLALELQPKLLRALQEGEVLPVGATQPVRVDVRVVAATHRDLVRAIHDRQFREDLYARLSAWELSVPSLRERRADLLAWIDRIHGAWAARRDGAQPLRFAPDAAEAILRFAWPLNLRGLERLVHELGAGERGGAGGVVKRAALPSWLGPGAVVGGVAGTGEAAVAPPERAVAAAREAVPTRDEFVRAFEELGGSVHGLGKRFGRDRRQIYRWIEAHGLGERRGGASRKDR